MKLLNQAIINVLPPLRSTESIPLANKTIICKFYSLESGLSWYIFEGEADPENLYRFFGVMVREDKGHKHAMMGYFNLAYLLTFKNIQLDPTVFMASYADALKETIKMTGPFYRRFLIEKMIRALPPLYSTEDISIKDKTLICRFFIRNLGGPWDVYKGELDKSGDYLFFGLVHGIVTEWGYFCLSELFELNSLGHLVLLDDLSSTK